jgi:hypothetical protein
MQVLEVGNNDEHPKCTADQFADFTGRPLGYYSLCLFPPDFLEESLHERAPLQVWFVITCVLPASLVDRR